MPKRHMPTDKQIDTALRHVRNALANGDIKPRQFNQRLPGIVVCDYGCDTALCIGGWAALLLYRAGMLHPRFKGDMSKAVSAHCAQLLCDDMALRSHRLYMLFYGHDGNPTANAAVAAIDRYFKGNHNPWNRPLARKLPE